MSRIDGTLLDDISRVLHALQNQDSHAAGNIQTELDAILAKYVANDGKKFKKEFPIRHNLDFPLVIKKGAPILAGGGGIVLKAANQMAPGVHYALKTPRPSLLRSENAAEESKRAITEYISHAPLSHENVARLFSARRIEVVTSGPSQQILRARSPLFVMEWIDGPDRGRPLPLMDYVRREVKTGAQLCDVLVQCFAGLQHLHSRGFIHWDIKSDNFLVGTSKKPKLMDIGNARSFPSNPDDQIAYTTLGHYPPKLVRPEQQNSSDPNRVRIDLPSPDWDCPWLDMWMLARELASVLGQRDFGFDPSNADDANQDGEAVYLTQVFSPDVDSQFCLRGVRLILRRLLKPDSPDEEQFYRSAEDVIADLLKLTPEFGAAQDLPELRAVPQKVVRIPVSGNVPLTARVKALISREPVKRLTRHLQLGTIVEVYPGGAHRRFEHSLGVFFAAIQYAKALYADRTSVFWRLTLSKEDVEALLIAALIHDVGHLAYGHYLEEMGSLFSGLTHEEYAQLVLRGAHAPNRAAGALPEHVSEAAAKDRAELLAILKGDPSSCSEDLNSFLMLVADILSGQKTSSSSASAGEMPALFNEDAELNRSLVNKFKIEILHSVLDSALDVDKLDYLRRDALHAGVDYALGIDVDRLLQSLTTLHYLPRELAQSYLRKGAQELTACVAIDSKGILPLESLLIARYQMFQSVYWHHTARAHTAMLQFCVCEFLACHPEGVIKALHELVEEFRGSSDDAALRFLASRLSNSLIEQRMKDVLIGACDALLGVREKAYKEAFVLPYKGHSPSMGADDVIAVYKRLVELSESLFKASTPSAFVKRSKRLRREFTSALTKKLPSGVRIVEGELLVDIPPAGRDQVNNLFVLDRGGAHKIEDLSYMAFAVSESFRYWTRPFRIFLSPALMGRLRNANLLERQLSDLCWEVLSDKFVEQKNLL